ncbi:asparaginase [Paenibacillus athensensis]|uniref:Asparaginase n=1 Tax=Paenibacillus athensensis TaxID=1967502 RepID=A0A4Y8PTM4_9BACL|nr:asparaginase [Paenibacillus athensensis]MCD1257920.1 asparaginase [Paenibacillus athensensis]
MLTQPREIVVRVCRGPLTESVHRGHMAVIGADGRLVAEAGDARLVTFARSAAKPLQALPVIEAGAADAYGFTAAELALLSSSHSGEAEHVEAAAALLGKLGLSAAQLQCGVHEPFDAAAAHRLRELGELPTSLHNNCSGKHAGMLALALQLGAPTAGYMDAAHPVQLLMRSAVAAMCGLSEAALHIGVDGCGVPVFGMALDRLAYAYARLGTPEDLPAERAAACARVVAALRTHPRLLAGSGRFDTRLIEATNGRLIGKMGAEGVFAVCMPGQGLGMALKIADGQQRALYPAVSEALRQLGWLQPGELLKLAEFHEPVQRNWQGTKVGRILPEVRL